MPETIEVEKTLGATILALLDQIHRIDNLLHALGLSMDYINGDRDAAVSLQQVIRAETKDALEICNHLETAKARAWHEKAQSEHNQSETGGTAQ